MTGRILASVLVAGAWLVTGAAAAQPANAPRATPPAAPRANPLGAAARAEAGAATLSPDRPLQCWWRTSAGAVRIGEVFEITLTCAVLESPAATAVPDESRLTVAAVQLMPFEIVGGSHPPDVRDGERRMFQYAYQVRLLDSDAIGHDVKLPALGIPYRVQSQAGTAAAQAGRDFVHLLPQLIVRVVSQVPADADDIRDGVDASLTRIDALRFRANTFRAGAMVLGALGLVALLGAAAPLLRRLRTRRAHVVGRASDRAVLRHAAGVLDGLARDAAGGWTPESLAAAHGAVRLVTAGVLRDGVRQLRLGHIVPVPEGRLLMRRRLRRGGDALTAHITGAAVGRALAALPAGASATERARLERLRDGLDALTRAQYVQGASLDDRAAIDEAVTTARDLAREVARERLWSPRDWFRAAAPAPPTPGA